MIPPNCRAVVIVPPLSDFYFTRHRFSSLGANIVYNLLVRFGCETHLLNFPLMNTKGTVQPLPDALSYLSPFLIENETGRLSFFTRFRRFGPAPETCAEMIEKLRPDICFFSLFAFCYADDAILLAEKIKTKIPMAPVVFGGAGATAYPGYFLKSPAIDYVLAGEAEVSLSRFIDEISLPQPDFRRVSNLVWKENGYVITSPLLCHPSGDEIEPVMVKTAESSRSVTYSTSLGRGCPKQCDFCSSRLMFGKTLRTPSLGRLETMLKDVPDDSDCAGKQVIIDIEDDNLLCNERFFRSTVSLFRKRFPGAEFTAENGIDYSLCTPELCDWMINNGMSKFNLSLASLDREIASKRKRFLQLDTYEKITAVLSKRGIPSVTYFICGLKGDTLETTVNSLSYLYNKQTVIGLSMFYAVPGLPGLPGFDNYSLFDKGSSLLCLGSAAFPWNNSLSTETMITAFRLSRYSNLLKNPSRSEKENECIAAIADKKELHTIIKGKSGSLRVVPVPKQDRELVRRFFDLRPLNPPQGDLKDNIERNNGKTFFTI